MKKNMFLIALIALFIIPFKVWALPSEYASYTTMNLDQALTQEEVEHDLSNYKETDDQVTIYLFRGYGCPHCQEFLEFLNSIVEEHGSKFKLVSFEVYYDQNNGNLMEEVGTFLNKSADGIPFIIIGNQTFAGYGSTMSDQIISAIDAEYNKKERYDVFEEMAKASKKKENTGTVNTPLIIACNLIFVALGAVVVIAGINAKHNEVLDAIDELEEKLLGTKKEDKVKSKDKKKNN